MGIDIPAGTLKAGENRIELINTMKELPSDRKKLPQTGIDIGDVYETNYFRGWIKINKIILLDLSGEFAKFAAGQGSVWKQSVGGKYHNPKAVFEAADGKLHMATDVKRVSAAVATRTPRHYGVTPGEKLKFSALISGKGEFALFFQCLDAKGKYNRKTLLKKLGAPAEEKWVSWTGTVPPDTVYILPGIFVNEGGDCRIAGFKIESVKP